MALEDSLKQYFGFDSFRSGQKEVIESLLSGQDVLGILPTATGKSLCYQLPSYLTSGITIVVSPLISLMEDQVSQLNSKKIQAVALNSQLTAAEKEFVLWHLSDYKFLFISPEMLWQKKILHLLKRQKIAFFVIDEAHCVSLWGIDFRPEYRQLGKIKAFLENPVTLALTATATPFVQSDIAKLLLKEDYELVQRSV
ncbi:MAG: DEAD/DEAH box helicase, partial [Enterococcus sp.]